MVFRLARRALLGGMAFFALLGFASVPLGDKTGWGHLQAILKSPASEHAINETKASMGAARSRVSEWVKSWAMREVSQSLLPQASAEAEQPDKQVKPQHWEVRPSRRLPSPQPPRLSP